MAFTVVSFNGDTRINDGVHYQTLVPEDAPAIFRAQAIEVDRADLFPAWAGKKFDGVNLPLRVVVLGGSLRELAQIFDPFDQAQHALVVQDGAGVAWFLLGAVLTISEVKGNGALVLLRVSDPILQAATAASTTWLITGSGQKKTVTVGGNCYARPAFDITPTGAAAGGWANARYVTLYNRTSRAYQKRYAVEVTNGGWDTAALVAAGALQASGDDVRVIVDGVEVDFWMGDFNTDHTKVWANFVFKPRIEMTLGLAVAASGAVGELQLEKTPANTAAIKLLPASGTLVIDDERFNFSGKDEKLLKLGGVQRGVKQSAMGAHAAKATVRWLEHDVWLVWGDANAEAAAVDDRFRPAFDLSLSSNVVRVYDGVFGDADLLRSGSFERAVLVSTGKSSLTYDGEHGTDAEPAERLGMAVLPWQQGTRWQAEKATVQWMAVFPSGISKVSANGEKLRVGSAWPALAGLDYSIDLKSWKNLWNETSPVNAGQWTAWSRQNTSVVNTAQAIRFVLSGSIAAAADAAGRFETAAVTVELVAANTPFVAMAAGNANYQFRATLVNETTGEEITLNFPMVVDKTLTVDSAAKTILYEGANALAALQPFPARAEWLRLLPGENALRFDSDTTGPVTVVVRWRNRLNQIVE